MALQEVGGSGVCEMSLLWGWADLHLCDLGQVCLLNPQFLYLQRAGVANSRQLGNRIYDEGVCSTLLTVQWLLLLPPPSLPPVLKLSFGSVPITVLPLRTVWLLIVCPRCLHRLGHGNAIR